MTLTEIYKKARKKEFLNEKEGLFLYENAPLQDLIYIANELKKELHPGNIVTWQIDRNVNITNVCYSQCKFCNYYTKPGANNAFITSVDEYKPKIETLFRLGGDQLLLQGGLHPKLGLKYYKELFAELKSIYPNLKLHALGPPEIVHLAKKEKRSYKEVLDELIQSGLDSLPGAGAEILSDRVRKILSPTKASAKEWLDVMRDAHQLGMVTSATMMFGHIETPLERIQHLISIRNLQNKKPNNQPGFLAFIPWPFQDENTDLKTSLGIHNSITAEDYIRMISTSRILLPNITNIQASWLTVGKEVAQMCLHAGANDFGSIMIEENVVSAAGANYSFDAEGIQKSISEAGFKPQLRNQKYEYREYKPSNGKL